MIFVQCGNSYRQIVTSFIHYVSHQALKTRTFDRHWPCRIRNLQRTRDSFPLTRRDVSYPTVPTSQLSTAARQNVVSRQSRRSPLVSGHPHRSHAAAASRITRIPTL